MGLELPAQPLWRDHQTLGAGKPTQCVATAPEHGGDSLLAGTPSHTASLAPVAVAEAACFFRPFATVARFLLFSIRVPSHGTLFNLRFAFQLKVKASRPQWVSWQSRSSAEPRYIRLTAAESSIRAGRNRCFCLRSSANLKLADYSRDSR